MFFEWPWNIKTSCLKLLTFFGLLLHICQQFFAPLTDWINALKSWFKSVCFMMVKIARVIIASPFFGPSQFAYRLSTEAKNAPNLFHQHFFGAQLDLLICNDSNWIWRWRIKISPAFIGKISSQKSWFFQKNFWNKSCKSTAMLKAAALKRSFCKINHKIGVKKGPWMRKILVDCLLVGVASCAYR